MVLLIFSWISFFFVEYISMVESRKMLCGHSKMVTTTLGNNGSSIPNIEMEPPGFIIPWLLVIITITWDWELLEKDGKFGTMSLWMSKYLPFVINPQNGKSSISQTASKTHYFNLGWTLGYKLIDTTTAWACLHISMPCWYCTSIPSCQIIANRTDILCTHVMASEKLKIRSFYERQPLGSGGGGRRGLFYPLKFITPYTINITNRVT